MNLAELGLTEPEERLYRTLLRDPATPIGEDQVAAAGRLAELGLIIRCPGGRASVVDVETAVSGLIRQRISQANAELRRVATMWESLASLRAESSSDTPVEAIERIEDSWQVEQRIWSLALDAREALSMHPSRQVASAEPPPRVMSRLQEGVQWRTMVGRSSLLDPVFLAYCTTLHRAGDRHRVTAQPIQRLVILDRHTAFVPISPNRTGSGALVIRQSGAVATLVDLFEQTWAAATDLEPDRPSLTLVQRQVLHLLLTADKDESAAREMGVALRTYRRHVAHLLDHLQASNRFQAGVRAKELGWI
ncbi:hypothetical protein [Nonomuraea dietziae]|uniref:hypothetical protein n=1 Tax=Nonomuraea dietziae TaxID=65515 RepID=UPI0033D51A83